MANPLDLIAWRENAIHEQISAWHKLFHSESGIIALKNSQIDEKAVLKPLFEQLRKLYLDDLPIIKLRESSDVVVHVEGHDIHGDNPQLKAVNWLGRTMRTQFSRLATAAIQGDDKKAIEAAKDAQWEITGLVPGSLYMGFALQRRATARGVDHGAELLSDSIVNAAKSVSLVPQFIKGEGIAMELTEAITDPALRDAAMMAAMELAPSRRSQFTSVEIYVPGGSAGTLHHHERSVLREALVKPMMRKKIQGSFIGELKEIDLDSNRFQLRNINGIGKLRCVMEFSHESARRWLGNTVRVNGIYEADSQGRPRLMRVSTVDVISN